ncbi:MAG: DUF86 domain-containing protein [Deltaproteobacteria bacterium]|nr:DUF86 domain-containing protein [Deltaproteobacteria bacterium]
MIKSQITEELSLARKHLDYSYNRVVKILFDRELDEEQLEKLESFSSRFARFSEIAISKYFRVLVLERDPAFRGSIIDLLNHAEKHGWISSKDQWLRIRELRNVAAHEYSAADYKKLYQELIRLTPVLLQLSTQL